MIPAEAVEAAAKMYDAIAYGGDWELLNDYQKESRRRDAELILEAAAPYMQRTITTEAELETLPVGSIVAMIGSEPDAPAVACRAVLGWQFLGGDPERRYQSSALMPSPEPITVLHEAPNAR